MIFFINQGDDSTAPHCPPWTCYFFTERTEITYPSGELPCHNSQPLQISLTLAIEAKVGALDPCTLIDSPIYSALVYIFWERLSPDLKFYPSGFYLTAADY